ncbi:MAG: GNAT family N-acetyltransferase [Candidatus Nanohaloarchaea archaeon]|nr:GNAT family N-acetyltransferase [Candidatus Nanohaloarchaea archaeon]
MVEIVYPDIDEIENLHKVEKDCWEDLAASLEEMRKRYELHPEGYVAIRKEGEIAAFTFGIRYNYNEVDPDTWYEATDLELHSPDERDMYIVSVTVAPSFQGQGIGRRLMDATNSRAEEQGVDRVVLGSRDTTVGFFKKCGFDPVERKEEWWPEDEESEGYGVVMEYRL